MSIHNNLLILTFSGLLLLSSFPVLAQDPVEAQLFDPEVQSKLVAEQDDTFSVIAEREFGHTEIAVALAGYNQLALDTVFNAGQLVFYPSQFTEKPDSFEVVFVKGKASYLSGDNGYTIGRVEKGDILGSADIIGTGSDAFVSLLLPSDVLFNVQPERRFSLRQFQCLPDDTRCAVLIHEESDRIYLNVRLPDGRPVPPTLSFPYHSAAVRGPVFVLPSEEEIRNWPNTW